MSPDLGTAAVRVVLVDDDALVRAGLRLILRSAPDVEVVAEVEDGAAAIEVVQRTRPDVVLMDIRMPRTDGITATAQLVAAMGDAVRILVLTTFDTDDLVTSALRAGACGFLLKDTPPERLVSAIHTVAAGEPVLSPSVTASLIARVGTAGEQDRVARARERLAVLTEREHEVAVAVGQGLSNAQISASLYMSVPTVKAHMSRVLTKLGADNRVQVAIAVHDADLL